MIKSFFNEIDIYYSVRKKTFKAIYQLSCFLRHPVTNHWQKIKGQRCWWEGGGQEDFLHLSAVKQNGWTWITIKVIYISRINNNMFFSKLIFLDICRLIFLDISRLMHLDISRLIFLNKSRLIYLDIFRLIYLDYQTSKYLNPPELPVNLISQFL